MKSTEASNGGDQQAWTEDGPEPLMSQKAYRTLERMLVTLELAPGTLLSEVALSRRLGIGRTPIREGLRRLAREGLVEIKPRRGIIVTEINLAKHLRLLIARRALEMLVAREATEKATPGQRDRMRAVAEELDIAAAHNDRFLFIDTSWEQHRLPVEATHNEYIASLTGLLHGLSRRFWFAFHQTHVDLQTGCDVHARRLRAIAAGDQDAAAAATTDLMDFLDRFARSTLDYRPASAPDVIARPGAPRSAGAPRGGGPSESASAARSRD